jgi:catechol 2,3-dioxygenase-like lactoylglutathione lyase family enzyme
MSGGVQHVALPTLRADVDAEVAFWALLGFSLVTPPGSLVDRSTWVQADDGTQIHLLYVSEAEVRSGHVAVVAPAPFDATAAALRAAGHAVEDRTAHWGAARAYVHTPGGHLVEVMASPQTDIR